IVLTWDFLIARLASAMREFKSLCMGDLSNISNTLRTAPASSPVVPGQATPVTAQPNVAASHPRTLPAKLRVPPPPRTFPARAQLPRLPTTRSAAMHVSHACPDSCSLRCWSQSRRMSAKEREASPFVIDRCATNEPKPSDALENGVEALDVARVTPPPKSPAPAPAIADAVELGGLRDEVTLPRMAASARVPKEGAVAGRDARQGLDRLARSRRLAAESSAQRLSETESSAWPRSEIPQERILHNVDTVPNQQDAASRGKELRTVDHHSSVLVRGVATSSAPRPPASPLPRSIDKDCKAFALVNAIVRTIPSSHLVFNAHGDLVPEIAWEREGIGTRPWT
ncbi:hypothetical protein B0H15DRAFT_855875, partial [Mycena belliarum]